MSSPRDDPPAAADVELDPAGFVTGWSAQAIALFGLPAESVLGQPLPWLLDDTGAPDGPAELHLPTEGDTVRTLVERPDASGRRQRLWMTLRRRHDPDGQPVGLHIRYEPVRPDQAAEDERRHWLGTLLERGPLGLLVVDATGRAVAANPAFTRITGRTPDDLTAAWPALWHEPVPPLADLLHGGDHWHGEAVARHRDGRALHLGVSLGVVRPPDGAPPHVLCLLTPAHADAPAEAADRPRGHFDPVSGLPNRLLLGQLLGQLLAQARRSRAPVAVLAIRWPRLGRLYDTMGHEIGDAIVRAATARLQGALREQDVLARLGHDTVVAVLPALPRREHAALVAHKLVERLLPAYAALDGEVECPACIGVALYPDNGHEAAVLLRCAEVATQRAVEPDTPPVTFFSADMHERATERLRLEGELRRAGTHGELHLLLQPKVSLRTGRIVGAEALLRWRHPRHGLLGPAQFVALAEESNLILDLGDWVLQEACRILREWNARGWPMPPLAINVSARQFQPALPERIDELLRRHAVAPRQLQLEVTESVMVRGADSVAPIMEELAAMGLGLALDDFGTGYSSLAYLKRFPIRTLKIDRSFVTGIPHQISDCAIARAIVTMGQQLRQEIVAEGVETVAQMQFLRALGCDQLQGYLFSPPVALDAFERMVLEDRRLPLDPPTR